MTTLLRNGDSDSAIAKSSLLYDTVSMGLLLLYLLAKILIWII